MKCWNQLLYWCERTLTSLLQIKLMWNLISSQKPNMVFPSISLKRLKTCISRVCSRKRFQTILYRTLRVNTLKWAAPIMSTLAIRSSTTTLAPRKRSKGGERGLTTHRTLIWLMILKSTSFWCLLMIYLGSKIRNLES